MENVSCGTVGFFLGSGFKFRYVFFWRALGSRIGYGPFVIRLMTKSCITHYKEYTIIPIV